MDAFLGEIRLFSFGQVPKGWAPCNGQLLSINSNQALYALLGTFYGGDGRTTFGLPNLQGRAAVAQGPNYAQGQQGGYAQVSLQTAQLPMHVHAVSAVNTLASTSGTSPSPSQALAVGVDPTNNAKVELYGPVPAGAFRGLAAAGGNQPHENRQPFLALNYCIAVLGTFPSRS